MKRTLKVCKTRCDQSMSARHGLVALLLAVPLATLAQPVAKPAGTTVAPAATSATVNKNDVLLRAGKLQVTTGELAAALAQSSPAERQRALESDDALRGMVLDVYLRERLAAQALANKRDQGADAQAQLAYARHKALSEMELDAIDAASRPTPEEARKRARKLYDEEKTRFNTPEVWQTRHILVRASPAEQAQPQSEPRKRIEDIQRRLKAGEKFEDLARTLSEDPGSGAKGGDLGEVMRGRMVKPFDEAMATLKPGETSGVVASPYGFHLIRVDGYKKTGKAPYDEVEPMLLKSVYERAQIDGRKAAVEKFQKEAAMDNTAVEALRKLWAPAAKPN